MSYVINALIFCQCLSREKTLLGALIKWFADISADDRKELSQWGGIRVEVVPKCFRKTVQKFEWTGTFRGYFDPTNYVYGRAFFVARCRSLLDVLVAGHFSSLAALARRNAVRCSGLLASRGP